MMIGIGSKVEAHTGTKRNGSYKRVTGTVLTSSRKYLSDTVYVLEYAIVDAEGNEYRSTEGRMTRFPEKLVSSN